MSVKFKDESDAVFNMVETEVMLANRLMLEDIHRRANRTTPLQYGDLREQVSKKIYRYQGVITWKQPYAWYQERGFTSGPVVNYTTPGTGPWFARNAVEYVTRRVGNYFSNE